MGRNKGRRVWEQNGVIFMGGDVRKLLTDIDGGDILEAVLMNRVDKDLRVGDSVIYREIKGVKVKFTQKQIRSKRIYVEYANE